MAMLKREVHPNYKQSILSQKDIEAAQKLVADAVNTAAHKSQRFEFYQHAKIRQLLRTGRCSKSQLVDYNLAKCNISAICQILDPPIFILIWYISLTNSCSYIVYTSRRRSRIHSARRNVPYSLV